MKTTMFIATLLCAALAAAPAGAQSIWFSVEIPFDFTAGPKAMPAGTYEVSVPNPTAVVLRTADTTSAVVVLTHAAQSRQVLSKGKLVFRKYGNSYFLAEVWRGQSDYGRALPPSPAEREMAHNTNVQIASINASR